MWIALKSGAPDDRMGIVQAQLPDDRMGIVQA